MRLEPARFSVIIGTGCHQPQSERFGRESGADGGERRRPFVNRRGVVVDDSVSDSLDRQRPLELAV